MWLRDRDGTWRLSTPAVRPPVLTAASMVYDAGRRRVVLFGGYNSAASNATWFWDGTNWSELTTPPMQARPPARSDATMAYDPKRGVVVLTGGMTFTSTALDDVWELDGDTWVERHPVVRPTARIRAAMAWDPVGERVVLVGGLLGPIDNKETWAWDGQVWTQLADADPGIPGLLAHAMTTDTARDRIVLVGTRGDVQEWDGARWTIVDTLDVPDPELTRRCLHAAALDPLRREVVVFGGAENDAPNSPFGDTWIWNGSWRQEIVTPSPAARRGATMVFDAARGEIVMFGGCPDSLVVGETWVWKDGSWSKKVPVSSPPPRCYHASAYDPVREKVVVFGGSSAAGGAALGDTWTWDGTTWTDEGPGTGPDPRIAPTMAYDPVGEHIVLFGGRGSMMYGDTWTWNGQAWAAVPSLSSPAPRLHAATAWDAARKRIVLFGGTNTSTTSADVWEWRGTHWALIPTARPPIPRSRHTLVSDLDGAGVLAIGGFQTITPGGLPLDDGWRLAWDDEGVEELCTEADIDGDGRVGDDDPDCWSTLTPLCVPGMMTCDPNAPQCGDGMCNAELESCAACPADCGECAMGCGNFACEATETIASCPGDCGV
jgi:hypothetical protein